MSAFGSKGVYTSGERSEDHFRSPTSVVARACVTPPYRQSPADAVYALVLSFRSAEIANIGRLDRNLAPRALPPPPTKSSVHKSSREGFVCMRGSMSRTSDNALEMSNGAAERVPRHQPRTSCQLSPRRVFIGVERGSRPTSALAVQVSNVSSQSRRGPTLHPATTQAGTARSMAPPSNLCATRRSRCPRRRCRSTSGRCRYLARRCRSSSCRRRYPARRCRHTWRRCSAIGRF